jgi:hypothetical protein
MLPRICLLAAVAKPTLHPFGSFGWLFSLKSFKKPKQAQTTRPLDQPLRCVIIEGIKEDSRYDIFELQNHVLPSIL